MDFDAFGKAITEAYDAPIRAHARRVVDTPLVFAAFFDDDSDMTAEQKAAVLEWIDTAPLEEVAKAAFPDPPDTGL